MKILFLDHQGVMFLNKHSRVGTLVDFDSEAVKTLNSILIKTDIEIVVSSDWKLWVTLEEMGEFYLKQGIIKKPIAYTGKFERYIYEILNKQRSAEILQWLNFNENITHWVSVDDLDMSPYLNNFVKTDSKIGLLEEGIEEKILSFF
jgi:hypothetical protein